MKRIVVYMFAATGLAACATARIDAQWSDPQQLGHPASGKVFVACVASEPTVRRICQEKLAAQISAIGATPVSAAEGVAGDDKLLAAARSSGSELMVVATLSQVMLATSHGSAFGIGVGGATGRFGTGVGMNIPIGSGDTTLSMSYQSDTSVMQVVSGKPVWSGKASNVAIEVSDQLTQLMQVTIEAARKAGAL